MKEIVEAFRPHLIGLEQILFSGSTGILMHYESSDDASFQPAPPWPQ